MKIEEIQIKGLFGKKDICWKLNPQVNVLVGVNGSGKSTILSVIDSFIQQVIPDKLEEIIDYANMSFLCGKIELRIKERAITNELVENSNSIKEFEELKKDNLILAEKFISLLKKTSHFHANGKEITKLIESKEKYFYVDLIEANISNVHANQKIDLRTRSVKNPIDIEIQDTINELNKIKTPELIERLLGCMRVFFHQIDKDVEFDKNNELIYLDKATQKQLNYSYLSSGERQLIYILLRVALSNADKNKTAIILMDEPEISLHLDWQQHFIKQLTILNPDAQFIIVTHSPALIMDGWNDVYTDMEEITTWL